MRVQSAGRRHRLRLPAALLASCLSMATACGRVGADAEADAKADPAGRVRDPLAASVSPSPSVDFPRDESAPPERREPLLLTGRVEPIRGVFVTAPSVRGGNLQIRWIREDGSLVRKGDKIVEFDNASFVAELEEKRLEARRATLELARATAQAQAEAEEKAFAVQKARLEMEKTRIDADIPPEIVPRREHEEKQLALERARAAYDKALTDERTHRRTKEGELAIQRLALERTRYEIREAEEAIDALTIEAPVDGVVVVAEIRWERRKVQEGDTVWAGFPLLTLPDLRAMEVVAELSDVDDGRVEPGMKALVTLDAYPEISFRGEVKDVTPVAREVESRSLRRAFEVRIALEHTDTEKMRPDMAARVEVIPHALSEN